MVVFTVTWNKRGWLEQSEWVNIVWYIRTMTIYSVVKINEIVAFTGNIFNGNCVAVPTGVCTWEQVLVPLTPLLFALFLSFFIFSDLLSLLLSSLSPNSWPPQDQ